MTKLRATVLGMCSVLWLVSGCGDDTGGGGGDKDAGGNTGAKDAAADSGGSMACGTATCEVSEADLAWGAEACCVDASKNLCGVKSSHPVVMTPDGGTVSVGEALIQLISVAGDAGIVNTMPTLECVPKGAAGKPNATCPSETFDLADYADAGSDDAGASQTFTVPGCCRDDDGMCGYRDDATGLGCVKISQSFLGQVLGRKDQSCK